MHSSAYRIMNMCVCMFVVLYPLENFQKGWPEPVLSTTTRRFIKTEKAKLWSTTAGKYYIALAKHSYWSIM